MNRALKLALIGLVVVVIALVLVILFGGGLIGFMLSSRGVTEETITTFACDGLEVRFVLQRHDDGVIRGSHNEYVLRSDATVDVPVERGRMHWSFPETEPRRMVGEELPFGDRRFLTHVYLNAGRHPEARRVEECMTSQHARFAELTQVSTTIVYWDRKDESVSFFDGSRSVFLRGEELRVQQGENRTLVHIGDVRRDSPTQTTLFIRSEFLPVIHTFRSPDGQTIPEYFGTEAVLRPENLPFRPGPPEQASRMNGTVD